MVNIETGPDNVMKYLIAIDPKSFQVLALRAYNVHVEKDGVLSDGMRDF